MTDLLGPEAGHLGRKSRRPWVAVLAAQRSNRQPGLFAPLPDRVPAGVARTTTLRARAPSADRRAEAT